MEQLLQAGLNVTAIGMGVVFVLLTLLVGIIRGMSALSRWLEAADVDDAPLHPPVEALWLWTPAQLAEDIGQSKGMLRISQTDLSAFEGDWDLYVFDAQDRVIASSAADLRRYPASAAA